MAGKFLLYGKHLCMASLPSNGKQSILLMFLDRGPVIYSSVTSDEPEVIEGPVAGQKQWEWGGRWGWDSEYSGIVTLVRASSASVFYFGVLLEIHFPALTCRFV